MNCSKISASVSSREDAELSRRARARAVLRRLHPLLEPARCSRVLDVHELDADRAAVGLRWRRCTISRRVSSRDPAAEVAGGEGLVEVALGEPEVRELSSARRRPEQAERIEVREEVTADAVGVDQLGDALLQDLRLEALLLGHVEIEERSSEVALDLRPRARRVRCRFPAAKAREAATRRSPGRVALRAGREAARSTAANPPRRRRVVPPALVSDPRRRPG